MGNWNRALAWVLRLGGGVMLLAFGAVFMPTAWMLGSTEMLGLTPLPPVPLFQYLTRSLSMLYGVHGAVFVVAGSDPRRYAPMIAALAWLDLLMAALLLGIDLHAGMPAYWTFGEAFIPLFMGCLLLFLLSKARQENAAAGETWAERS